MLVSGWWQRTAPRGEAGSGVHVFVCGGVQSGEGARVWEEGLCVQQRQCKERWEKRNERSYVH